jgi:glyoxylase-like metal-dependent hydrolase (beta-lactamase superfamily II)
MIWTCHFDVRFFGVKKDYATHSRGHKDLMTLLNRQWQSVAGTRHVRIYPYLRKPDVLSSNTFLIETPEQITLIDPGAMEDQSREIETIVRSLFLEKPRAVLIYLTHCHIDHAFHAPRYLAMRDQIPVWIAVHHNAVETMITGDQKKTISELYGFDYPCFSPDISLLPPHVRDSLLAREIHLPDRTRIPVETVRLETTIDVPFYRKRLPLGCGDVLEWFPTPGHSPDSVCLRAGELLFIGDILAAVNPMVAGISGWSRHDYIHSATHLIWLLENTDIAWCCPGHGGVISSPQVIDFLGKMRSQAVRLGDIAEMDARRLRYTTEHALEILTEAEEVFSTIAGRLYYLAYHLENLEEEDLARHYRQCLEAEKIDECLLNLRLLADDLCDGKKLEVEFAHRALGIIQKVRTLFDQETLRAVIPATILHRANLLLMDFINATKGRRNLEDIVATDINRLMEDILLGLKKSPHDDDAIIDVANDKEQFLAALVSRIAYVPLFEDVQITFTPQSNLPLIRIAASRFSDTLTDFLGLLTVRDCKEICLSTAWEDDHGEIQVLCPGKNIKDIVGEAKWNSFARRFGMCGLELSVRGQRLHLRQTDCL